MGYLFLTAGMHRAKTQRRQELRRIDGGRRIASLKFEQTERDARLI